MTHSLAANLLGGYVNAALFALDDLFAVRILVFSARARAVLHRAKDSFAEKTSDLGLQRAVVDGLGLGDLTVRPCSYHIRRSKTDFY